MIRILKISAACILLAASACHGESAAPVPPVQAEKSQIHALSPEQKFMLESLRQTPFMALVQHTGVDVTEIADTDPSDDFAEQKLVYHAKVVKQFRGPKMATISYTSIIEKGEEPSIDPSPVLLSLCAEEGQWFDPGVGARFSASQMNLDLLTSALKQLPSQQTRYELCED